MSDVAGGYVDGIVYAVPSANRETYRRHAAEAAVGLKKLGALQVVECWGDDVPAGANTSFVKAVQCGDDETVVFSWVVWPSRQVRDAAMPKLRAGEGMPAGKPPFDGSRMIFGGFEVLSRD